jgi:hypothetical protein
MPPIELFVAIHPITVTDVPAWEARASFTVWVREFGLSEVC